MIRTHLSFRSTREPFYISTSTSKKIEYHEKCKYFFLLISESKTHILYRFITHSEIFQAFVSWNFDDYGLQIMKTKNSVSQRITILHKVNKKRIFETEISGFWKVCSFLCTQYLVGPPFAWITASMRRGMETISLWHCSGVMRAQVALKAAFRSSALLGLVSLIFLLTIPHRFSMGFRSGEFAGQSSTVTPWSLNQLLVPLAVCAGAKSCWKWNQHLHKAYQQKEAWSAPKFLGRWLR